jgi:hypothetical protein
MLALVVVPVLCNAALPFATGFSNILRTWQLWLLPPVLHMVVFWGTAVLSQRPGYTTSWQAAYRAMRFALLRNSASKNKARRSAHADCAADADVDALFYPASNLAVDKERFAVNALMWLVVIALKVLFEFGLVLLPLSTVVVEVS